MTPADIKVLIVDDDADIADAIAEVFRAFNFQVNIAPSGNKAWDLLQNETPHMILSDIRMADGDGLELVTKVRSRHPSLPRILFMSGFSDLLIEEIYHAGVEGFFSKPFSVQTVRDAIEKCLKEPEYRWSSAGIKRNPFVVEKKIDDIASAKVAGTVVFGRGGFFVAHDGPPPSKGSNLNFSIDIAGEKPIKFEGNGICRWYNTKGIEGAPAGLGIEITSMNADASMAYKAMFGEVPFFIPSPRNILYGARTKAT